MNHTWTIMRLNICLIRRNCALIAPARRNYLNNEINGGTNICPRNLHFLLVSRTSFTSTLLESLFRENCDIEMGNWNTYKEFSSTKLPNAKGIERN